MFFTQSKERNLDSVKGVVQKVIPGGKHGPFVVASADQLGSVTFSLEPTVWKEDEWPERGMMVFLASLRQKRAGWRAKEGRFWKPSDEQSQQSARSNQMQFLYPTSRQFPFDEVCERIVREVELRNWSVPGITVDFHEYGSGERKFRNTSSIKGPDFKLRFCRVQRPVAGGRYNDIAAVTDIVIPKKEINVYEDESGPTFYLYVGKDWEKDREKFMNGSKVNSKLNGEPRTYLQYHGSIDTDGIRYYRGQRPPYLIHDNDLGREYDPKWREPKVFSTDRVMKEFKRYLEGVVLKMILSYPIPTEKVDIFAPAPAVPMPEVFNTIFCFGKWRDAERIKQGKLDPSGLQAADRYALNGSGYRLISLGTSNDGTVPEIAYDGFLWCGLGEVTQETPLDCLKIHGRGEGSGRDSFVIRVKPNRANGIYIADHAKYEKRRKEIGDTLPKDRDRFTDAEVADFVRARARTIIPISEYKGDFAQPVVLINRELSFDEVEIVSGPLKDHLDY